jgi:hypothetical protein
MANWLGMSLSRVRSRRIEGDGPEARTSSSAGLPIRHSPFLSLRGCCLQGAGRRPGGMLVGLVQKARQRTFDAMIRKARAGHVTGGRVFGYDNVEVLWTTGKRSHVERRINESGAAIVRRIFELCAEGVGKARIARLLNEVGAPTPRSQQRGPQGWVTSPRRVPSPSRCGRRNTSASMKAGRRICAAPTGCGGAP